MKFEIKNFKLILQALISSLYFTHRQLSLFSIPMVNCFCYGKTRWLHFCEWKCYYSHWCILIL